MVEIYNKIIFYFIVRATSLKLDLLNYCTLLYIDIEIKFKVKILEIQNIVIILNSSLERRTLIKYIEDSLEWILLQFDEIMIF